MNKIISMLLVSLLGFLGCSGSDAGTSAVTLQAFGLMDEYGLSFTAHVMDQEGNLLSDAMVTINGEPMNIGFFPPENLILDQGDGLYGANDQTVKGVECGDYQPYYFLDFLDVNGGDTVEFVAKGSQCFTVYSSSVVVPEKIRIIEPSGEEPIFAGEPVVVRWQGGAPYSQFHVIYYRGSDGEMFSSGMIQGSTEFIMPAHWIHEGWSTIFVEGSDTGDEYDQKGTESAIETRVQADIYIEVVDGDKRVFQTGNQPCLDKCNNSYKARKAVCGRWVTRYTPTRCKSRAYLRKAGCFGGCGSCP